MVVEEEADGDGADAADGRKKGARRKKKGEREERKV